MANSLADQYYIKALDGYPYDLEESLENLNYALSYDEEHDGALYLMGCFCMDQLNDKIGAEEYFQSALAINPQNYQVAHKYACLMIELRAYSKAEKLIQYAYKIIGVDRGSILRTEALLYEYQKEYEKAIHLLEDAKDNSYNSDFTESLDRDIERVKEKVNRNSKNKLKFIYDSS